MSKKVEQDYINDPKHGPANRKRVEKAKAALEAIELKLVEEGKAELSDNWLFCHL